MNTELVPLGNALGDLPDASCPRQVLDLRYRLDDPSLMKQPGREVFLLLRLSVGRGT